MNNLCTSIISHFGTKDQSYIQLVEAFIDNLFHPFCLKSIWDETSFENDDSDSKILNVKNNKAEGETHTYLIADNFMMKWIESLESRIWTLSINDNDKLAHVLFILGHVSLNLSRFSEQLNVIMKLKTEMKKNEILASLNKSKNANLINNKSDDQLYIDEEIEYNLMDCNDAKLEEDSEELSTILDSIISKEGTIARYFPVIFEIIEMIQQKYNGFGLGFDAQLTSLENMCLVTFWKFMIVNKSFWEENIERFFNLLSLENLNPHNLLVWIKELYKKFPLVLDKLQLQYYYARN